MRPPGWASASAAHQQWSSTNSLRTLDSRNAHFPRKIPSPKPGKPAAKPAPAAQPLKETSAESKSEEVPCCADAVPSSEQGNGKSSDIAKIKAKFIDFLGSANAPHGLDAYTKQAMAIALSVAMRCEPCLKMHLKKAKEKGFTQDEIDEAAWMGISFGGSPTMVFYEQLKNS